MKMISLKKLAAYDGKNGHPAWVAFEGLVYDITESFLWQNGEHQALHKAGCDLTKEMANAPHGVEMFEGFPVVAKLKRE